MSAATTRNLTILLTDIKGFTEKTSRKSRAEVLTMLELHKEIVLPVLEARGGQLIKTIGDAFLMVFESPTDAVLSGVEVQEALLQYNDGKKGDDRLDIRIAINVGEVNLTDDDVFGEPVNITARIEAIAEAGEVYFSEAVYLAMNKREVPTSEIGFRKLKGISEEIKLYKVKRESPVEELPPEDSTEPESEPIVEKKSDLPPPVVGPVVVPGIMRRVGALVVDFVICMLIFGVFFENQNNQHKSDHHKNQSKQALNKKFQKKGIKVQITEDIVKIGGIEISEDGIKGKNIDISEDGLKMKGGIEISEERVKFGNNIDIETKKGARKRKKKEAAKEAAELADDAADLAYDAAIIADEAADAADEAHELANDPEATASENSMTAPEAAGAAVQEIGEALEEVAAALEEVSEEEPSAPRPPKRKKNERAFPFLWFMYGTFFLTIWSATPGKRLFGLRVIHSEAPTSAPLDWKTAAIRSGMSVFSSMILMIGYAWGVFSKNQRTWHDIIAKTRVVRG